MFTGIILKMGRLVSLEKKHPLTLTVETGPLAQLKIGDSVAVNGACLTVVSYDGKECRFHLSEETWARSHFSDLTSGSYVNLELPLTLQDFLGGHLVSGHLDGVARLKSLQKRGSSTTFSFTYQDREWKKFIIPKGSVTVNGISLTVSELRESLFAVEVIPHTLENTNLKYAKIGERMNLELDLLGKYVYNFKSDKKWM